MYTDFFGLREKPFALSPDPRYLFLSGSHREALAHLLFGIEEGEGFIAITGEVGTGKTTLCRTLLERLANSTEVAFLFNPIGSGLELLRAIAREFGLEASQANRTDLNDRLNRFLLEKKSEGRRVLLIVDEAQDLSVETLEEIRLLSNLETSSSKLIQILLLGQPELARKLDSAELRQLRQRISVRWNLGTLSARETRDYVRHRIRVAGDPQRELFADSALRLIYRRTQGVPRLINVLCDRSLLAAYGAGATTITAAIVRRAARELSDTQPRPYGLGAMAAGALGGRALVAAGAFVMSGNPGNDGRPEAAAQVSEARLPAVSSPPPAARGFREEPEASLQVPLAEPPPVAAASFPGATAVPSLAVALSSDGEAEARMQAINTVLASYGLAPFGAVAQSLEEALSWLSARGLTVLEIDSADLSTLRALNHPALLELVADDGLARLVTLGKLDADRAVLYGAGGGERLPVDVAALGENWNGRAWIVWQSFEPIPEVMVRGEYGSGVAWLQAALSELGYYAGDASGRFDDSTFEGVRAFQVNHAIEADGAVGPRTQMILYDLLDRYDVPRLKDRRGAG